VVTDLENSKTVRIKRAVRRPLITLSAPDMERVQALLANRKIEVVPISTLRSNPRNAKHHPEEQIIRIARNIGIFGFTVPILIDEAGELIAGHARCSAAKMLGLTEVPAIRLTDLTELDKRVAALADNKLPELGTWNIEVLKSELIDLTDPNLVMDFDSTTIGFDTVEIDALLDAPRSRRPDPADALPPTRVVDPQITRLGDVWLLEHHRLICGDALNSEAYLALLREERADIVFGDPPRDLAKAQLVIEREGNRTPVADGAQLAGRGLAPPLGIACQRIADHSRPSAVVYLCTHWQQLDALAAATLPVFGKPKDLVVWVNGNDEAGEFYHPRHELIGVYVTPGKEPPTCNLGAGARERHRSNVWQYPDFNNFAADDEQALRRRLQPGVKPVALVADVLRDCSRRRALVLDPFAGSGTTLIAAERTGRRARLIEINPHRCDVIVRRWQAFSKVPAYLAGSGCTFDEVAATRRPQDGEA
jgi:DNA modification methylase